MSRTVARLAAFASVVTLAVLLGPWGFLVLVGLVLAGPVGGLLGASLRAPNERSPTHRALSATADTEATPPAGLLHAKARAVKMPGATYGAKMAAACGCTAAGLTARRTGWKAKAEPGSDATPAAACGCPR